MRRVTRAAAASLSLCLSLGCGAAVSPAWAKTSLPAAERFAFQGPAPLGLTITGFRSGPAAIGALWRVIVVTGAPSFSGAWRRVMARAPKAYDFVVVERPGYGGSAREDGFVPLAAQMAAIEPLVENLRGERVILIGEGYGAPAAAALATQRPDRVEALAIIAADFAAPTKAARRRLRAVAALDLAGYAPHGLKSFRREAKTRRETGVFDGVAPADALAGLSVPTAVIAGTDDPIAPVKRARALLAALPPAAEGALVTVEDGGHHLARRHEDALLSVIDGLIVRAEARKNSRQSIHQSPAPAMAASRAD